MPILGDSNTGRPALRSADGIALHDAFAPFDHPDPSVADGARRAAARLVGRRGDHPDRDRIARHGLTRRLSTH